MKVALAHDYILRFGGAEKVLLALHRLFPQAPVYTIFADQKVCSENFKGADIRPSFLNKAPGLYARHRWALPLIPTAVETLNFHDYDIVISSSSSLIKGLVVPSRVKHICYCHTPPRFLWEDREQYLKLRVPVLLRPGVFLINHFLRLWDQSAAKRPDVFLANSAYTASRVEKYYNRKAKIVYPPVDIKRPTTNFEILDKLNLPEEFFLLVSYLDFWKNPEVVVETFNRLELPLFIVGDGPMRRRLNKLARGNVKFLGYQDDETLSALMRKASALIHPSVEDFGMAAVEAMAFGTPVIAFGRGGVLESVLEGFSGEFFDDLHPIALADAVRRFRENSRVLKYNPEEIKESVKKFAPENFNEAIKQEVLKLSGGNGQD